ncbi:hypothetical protein Esti_006749 [Eimeria stiedai]
MAEEPTATTTAAAATAAAAAATAAAAAAAVAVVLLLPSPKVTRGPHKSEKGHMWTAAEIPTVRDGLQGGPRPLSAKSQKKVEKMLQVSNACKEGQGVGCSAVAQLCLNSDSNSNSYSSSSSSPSRPGPFLEFLESVE